MIEDAGLCSASPAQVNAPEFPDGLEWINTDRPLRLAELRGKLVLLDFWTFCCINCLHVLPAAAGAGGSASPTAWW